MSLADYELRPRAHPQAGGRTATVAAVVGFAPAPTHKGDARPGRAPHAQPHPRSHAQGRRQWLDKLFGGGPTPRPCARAAPSPAHCGRRRVAHAQGAPTLAPVTPRPTSPPCPRARALQRGNPALLSAFAPAPARKGVGQSMAHLARTASDSGGCHASPGPRRAPAPHAHALQSAMAYRVLCLGGRVLRGRCAGG